VIKVNYFLSAQQQMPIITSDTVGWAMKMAFGLNKNHISAILKVFTWETFVFVMKSTIV